MTKSVGVIVMDREEVGNKRSEYMRELFSDVRPDIDDVIKDIEGGGVEIRE